MTEEERRARLLLQAMVALLALLAVYVGSYARFDLVLVVVGVFGIFATITAALLARAHRVDAASAMVTFYLFVALAAVGFTEGPSSPRMSLAVVAVSIVGCLTSVRLTLAFGTVLMFVFSALGVAESNGLLRATALVEPEPWVPFARQVLVVGLLGMILRRGYDQVLGELLERQRARAEAVHAARSINASLERLVEERTAELRTVRDQKGALAQTLADHLTSSLADLRAELHGLVDWLPSFDERDLRYVERAAQAADRLEVMVARLHDHAELGASAHRPSVVDLARLAREIADELGEAPKIEWTIDALPPAWIDPSLVRTVLENLLGNAVKFSASRAPARIHVGWDAAEARYFVRDNGLGFDPRHAARLFTPFQRLHAARDLEGHGVGLANVRRIVEAAGGDVGAEGKPGEGATFFFRLPAAEEER